MGWRDRRKRHSFSGATPDPTPDPTPGPALGPAEADVRARAEALRDGSSGKPPAEAIADLEESERLYASLHGGGGPDGVPVLAGIQCRKGLAQAEAGRGASAVLTLDEALNGYDAVEAGQEDSPHLLDHGHALLVNAEVLLRYGDPDLAAASADGAVRQYRRARDRTRSSPGEPPHEGRFARALAIAAALHRKGGRPRLAREAEAEAARMSAVSSPEVTGADRLTLRRAIEQARTTLGRSDVPELLDSVLTDPGVVPTAGWRVSLRCPRAYLAVGASHLARVAHSLTVRSPRRTDPARTLALEAHYLFATASAARVPELRYEFGTYGTDWARALLWLARTAYEDDAAMAGDLTDWLRGVLTQLTPHTLVSSLAREVFEEADAFAGGPPA